MSESWRVERRDREAILLSDVAAFEGGSGFLGGMEAVMIESWRVDRGAPGRETEKPAPGVNSRGDSVERLVSGYIIIGRCGFGVVEVLM